MKAQHASYGSQVALGAAMDVTIKDGRHFSSSNEPWLHFETFAPFAGAHFVEIVYRAGLFDDPVRPVLRFVTPHGHVDRILPGPVAGTAIWRGAIPRGATGALISPAAREGRFDFRVERVTPLAVADMLRLVWRGRREKLFSILLAGVFGYVAEAENAMDWAINAEPLENFADWRAQRRRPLDALLDAPRSDWTHGANLVVFIDAEGASPTALAQTLASLDAQRRAPLRIVVVGGAGTAQPIALGRLAFVAANSDLAPSLRVAHFVAILKAGDAFEPEAIAAFTEAIARQPGARLLYGDEIEVRADGPFPAFKPDWSPQLECVRPYVGRCAFLRAPDLRMCAVMTLGRLAESLDHVKRGLAHDEVAHVRRFLMSRAPSSGAATSAPVADRTDILSASIVLLTRDRGDLLEPCLDSLLARTTHPDFELLIVDNGTREARALARLELAGFDPRVRIIREPGAFNFAVFNNAAARLATRDVLVFLNNDTEIVTADWLERLTTLAVAPDAGAVGALLLFPDGRVQHAGVIVGLGQDAGHFEALQTPDAQSWLDRVGVRHETSAVTAACMAVERRKFEAVGGFDEARFPIEFNDVDLCLRLGERGWRSICAPDIRLIHKESASRGNARARPLSVHANERAYFRERWRSAIRDDRYFHPGLSLYARRAALS